MPVLQSANLFSTLADGGMATDQLRALLAMLGFPPPPPADAYRATLIGLVRDNVYEDVLNYIPEGVDTDVFVVPNG
jgi:hypothetical protein